ncbi:MAG: LysM peptidoglycan-binding domain-containing protein, partial [Acidimicrobiales bacterium]
GPTPPVEPAAAPAPPPTADPHTWTVQPGDHFWSVAERVLAEAWRRPPTDTEVDPYWRTLVEANRARLRDPGNPDLLFPGQVIEVPALPAPPG